jgi:hypothetical protein
VGRTPRGREEENVKLALVSRAVLVSVLALPATAVAQVKESSPVFVVDASDNGNRMTVVSVKTFNEALRGGTPGEAPAIDRYLSACSPGGPTTGRTELLKKLHDCVDCLKAHQELRYFTKRGDIAVLIVLVPDRFPVDTIVPHFAESARQSELVSTALALGRIALEQQSFNCRAFTYTLQRKRARLKAVIPNVAHPATPTPVPVGTGTLTTPEVITGPREHLFMSADMSFEKDQFKFGETPEPDKEKIKNKTFFAALNFSVGDLLVDRDSTVQRRSLLKELVFKVQVAISEEPFDSWAVGIGLRGDWLKAMLWNMDVIHPYVTYGKVPDATDPARTHSRWAFGLGYDPRGLSR